MASSSSDLSKRAMEAFVDDNFDLAVDLLTQAIAIDPNNADLFADRAQANIKFGSFTEAVADANRAIELDPSMAKAYFRKGTACVMLEEYQTAKTALQIGASLAPGDARFSKLIKECDECLAAEESNGLPAHGGSNGVQTVSPSTMSQSSNVTNESLKDLNSVPEISVQAPQPVKPKFRHDFYNSTTEVVLTIFAKGIPATSVAVDFGEQTLSVRIDLPNEEEYHFQPRLFGKIVPDKCRYIVLSTKIEIHLFKADAITWTSLEFTKNTAFPQKIISSGSTAPRPVYPSSKSKVDWDKLEAQVKNEEKDEKLEGDAALNKMFRDIYQDADEDTRRAMQKSFLESNGTVLSTNWKEVGQKKVEGSPPDGMELKKWEY